MTTFADAILDEDCDHEWYVEHTNWAGTHCVCIYCDDTKYIKNETMAMNC